MRLYYCDTYSILGCSCLIQKRTTSGGARISEYKDTWSTILYRNSPVSNLSNLGIFSRPCPSYDIAIRHDCMKNRFPHINWFCSNVFIVMSYLQEYAEWSSNRSRLTLNMEKNGEIGKNKMQGGGARCSVSPCFDLTHANASSLNEAPSLKVCCSLSINRVHYCISA